ncbi:hypothetical protein BGP_3410 [Beggiatoa sp. PS]|nr:hypothetical protein BGP_3410 [Beggiatoa sp. PS]
MTHLLHPMLAKCDNYVLVMLHPLELGYASSLKTLFPKRQLWLLESKLIGVQSFSFGYWSPKFILATTNFRVSNFSFGYHQRITIQF